MGSQDTRRWPTRARCNIRAFWPGQDTKNTSGKLRGYFAPSACSATSCPFVLSPAPSLHYKLPAIASLALSPLGHFSSFPVVASALYRLPWLAGLDTCCFTDSNSQQLSTCLPRSFLVAVLFYLNSFSKLHRTFFLLYHIALVTSSLHTPHYQLPYGRRNRYEGGGEERLEAKTLKPHARKPAYPQDLPTYGVQIHIAAPGELAHTHSTTLPHITTFPLSPNPPPSSSYHPLAPKSAVPSHLRRTLQRPTPVSTLPQLLDALLRPLGTDGPRFRTLKSKSITKSARGH